METELCSICQKKDWYFGKKYDKKSKKHKIQKIQYIMPKKSPHGKSKTAVRNEEFICSKCTQKMLNRNMRNTYES